jgi:hypothetical protein
MVHGALVGSDESDPLRLETRQARVSGGLEGGHSRRIFVRAKCCCTSQALAVPNLISQRALFTDASLGTLASSYQVASFVEHASSEAAPLLKYASMRAKERMSGFRHRQPCLGPTFAGAGRDLAIAPAVQRREPGRIWRMWAQMVADRINVLASAANLWLPPPFCSHLVGFVVAPEPVKCVIPASKPPECGNCLLVSQLGEAEVPGFIR